jgi:2-keto-4-pentenoate hydratase/2-oxohepta-3-ene-1,7-dioic acid hydratase in catechol pathway
MDKDLGNLRLELRVNGELRQQGRTSLMIFSPQQLITYISSFMTLEEGDIIATGTPEGVGPLRPGDEVEAWVEGVGRVRNPVI